MANKKYGISIEINTVNIKNKRFKKESYESYEEDSFEKIYSYVQDDFNSFQTFLNKKLKVKVPLIDLNAPDRNISTYISSYLDLNGRFSHSFEKFSFNNYMNSISGDFAGSGILYNDDNLKEYSGTLSGGFGLFPDSGGFSGIIEKTIIDKVNNKVSALISGSYSGLLNDDNVSGFLCGNLTGIILDKHDLNVTKSINIRKF